MTWKEPNFNLIYGYSVQIFLEFRLILALINLLRAKSFIIVIEGTTLTLENLGFVGKGGLVPFVQLLRLKVGTR